MNLDQTSAVYEKLGFGSITLEWFKVSVFLAPVLAITFQVLGIGLLMKKPWARSGAVNFGYVSIVITILDGILTVAGFPGSPGSDNPNAGAMGMGGLILGILRAILGSIYPLLTIILLNQPIVREALDRRGN
ncbi:MAG: hypothetical protein HC866_22305 [Leptolyngbyaceae cyanobacterium RU_5_1]|nr:hypothetical protein [Leptolyngbyaceae cyanobacterium RU_5_1]